MLLELSRWLEQLQSLFGLFGYLTFRGILSALTALALSLWWGPAVIRRLAQLKGGQPIRKDGPQSHFSKAGTPTMGGALILLTIARLGAAVGRPAQPLRVAGAGGDGEQDQRAAHGRRAGLGEMRLRAFVADRLPALDWASLRIIAGPSHSDRTRAVSALRMPRRVR